MTLSHKATAAINRQRIPTSWRGCESGCMAKTHLDAVERVDPAEQLVGAGVVPIVRRVREFTHCDWEVTFAEQFDRRVQAGQTTEVFRRRGKKRGRIERLVLSREPGG